MESIRIIMKLIAIETALILCGIGYCYANSHLITQQTIMNAARVANNPLGNHFINKRQIANQEMCTAEVVEFQCSTDYGQTLVNISANCGNNQQARNFAGACATNENGDYCGIAALNIPTTTATCTLTGGCSIGCRNYLQSLRSVLGCCINSFLNFTDAPVDIYSYSLWSQCGVETVESCNNGPTFTPIFENEVCTDDDLHQQLALAECTPPYSQMIEETLSNAEGCDDFLLVQRDICLVNSQGEHCSAESRDELLSLTETGTALVLSVVTNCAIATSTGSCSTSCRNSLRSLRSDLGCCANVLYNNPRFETNPLVPTALWSICSLNDPGFCDTPMATTESEQPAPTDPETTEPPSVRVSTPTDASSQSEPTNSETMNQSTQNQSGNNSAGVSIKAFNGQGVVAVSILLMAAIIKLF